jgi:hypothetical protein
LSTSGPPSGSIGRCCLEGAANARRLKFRQSHAPQCKHRASLLMQITAAVVPPYVSFVAPARNLRKTRVVPAPVPTNRWPPGHVRRGILCACIAGCVTKMCDSAALGRVASTSLLQPNRLGIASRLTAQSPAELELLAPMRSVSLELDLARSTGAGIYCRNRAQITRRLAHACVGGSIQCT